MHSLRAAKRTSTGEPTRLAWLSLSRNALSAMLIYLVIQVIIAIVDLICASSQKVILMIQSHDCKTG